MVPRRLTPITLDRSRLDLMHGAAGSAHILIAQDAQGRIANSSDGFHAVQRPSRTLAGLSVAASWSRIEALNLGFDPPAPPTPRSSANRGLRAEPAALMRAGSSF